MKRLIVASLFVLQFVCTIHAELPQLPTWSLLPEYPVAPKLFAECAILVETETRTVLYEQCADTALPPASLTKLMTFYLVYEAVKDGALSLDEYLPVPPQAAASRQAAGSSLMFLAEGQNVSIRDLLKGLMVSSGNDAALALALLLEGSAAGFVTRMNDRAFELGYERMYFVDAAGLGASNRASAREWSDLAASILERWPETGDEYFSLDSFAYPQERHKRGAMPIVQQNRNLLLERYPGADGIKTGYTEEAGYTLVASAERQGRQLVAVLLSVPGASHAEGGERRTEDAIELFDWGFDAFFTAALPVSYPFCEVAGASLDAVELVPEQEAIYTFPRAFWRGLSATFQPSAELQWAPLSQGRVLAEMTLRYEGTTILRMPLVTAQEVPKGNVFRRARDAFRALFGWRPEIIRGAEK